MAQKLCAAAGKKYWFCNDYDVEMVDFDPDSGEVRGVFQSGLATTMVVTRFSNSTWQIGRIFDRVRPFTVL